MASIRDLKKDINFLTDAIVNDAFMVEALYKVEDKVILSIIEEAMENHTSLMDRARKRGEKGAFYKEIRRDLIAKTDATFKKIAELTK